MGKDKVKGGKSSFISLFLEVTRCSSPILQSPTKSSLDAREGRMEVQYLASLIEEKSKILQSLIEESGASSEMSDCYGCCNASPAILVITEGQ